MCCLFNGFKSSFKRLLSKTIEIASNRLLLVTNTVRPIQCTYVRKNNFQYTKAFYTYLDTACYIKNFK